MEIEFIEIKPKTRLTWGQLKDGEWFVFNDPEFYEKYGLCRKHYEEQYHGSSFQSKTGYSYRGMIADSITRVRIHKIVCEKVVEQ